MATNMSKKRKFVADGVFYAELNEVSQPTTITRHHVAAFSALRSRSASLGPYSSPTFLPENHESATARLGRQLLTQELAEEGYAGVEVRVTPLRTEIIISATRPQNVLGEKGQRIRELTSVVQKRCVHSVACNSV